MALMEDLGVEPSAPKALQKKPCSFRVHKTGAESNT